jgi:hypothetical protein
MFYHVDTDAMLKKFRSNVVKSVNFSACCPDCISNQNTFFFLKHTEHSNAKTAGAIPTFEHKRKG